MQGSLAGPRTEPLEEATSWYKTVRDHYMRGLGLTDHDFLACQVACKSRQERTAPGNTA